MADRYSEEWKAGLLDPERKLHGLGVAEFLEEAGLGPGMTMVDYGCGPGFVTLQAAKMLGPAGKVYGLDIHEGMVALARSGAADAGLANVTTLLNDGPQAPLPDGVADLVTCILVFHYKESLRERQAVAADLARLLKPGGRPGSVGGGHPVGRPCALRGDCRSAYGGRPRVRRAVLSGGQPVQGERRQTPVA